MRRSFSALVVVCACALCLSACGAKSAARAGEGTGAELAPADSIAFVSLDVERSKPQWRQALGLAARVPALQSALDRLGQLGVCLSVVEPRLGETVDIAVLPASEELSESVVVMTRPKDPAALRRLLTLPCCESSTAGCGAATTPPGAPALATREQDGWLLVSDSQAALDRFASEARRGNLAGSRDFESAFTALPKSALVRAYLDGEAVSSLLAGRLGGVLPELKPGKRPFEWIALSARPFERGLRLEGSASGLEAHNAPNTLIDEAPASSLLALSIGGSSYGLDQAVEESGGDTRLAWARVFLGLDQNELAALARGEIALYVTKLGSPGRKIAIDPSSGRIVSRPQLALELRAPEAGTIAGRIEKRLPALAVSLKGRAHPVVIAGARAEELTLGTLRLYFGGAKKRMFLSTDEAIVARGARLPARAAFAAAEKELVLPKENAGVLYLDLSGAEATTPASNRARAQSQAALLAYLDASKGGFRIEGVLAVR